MDLSDKDVLLIAVIAVSTLLIVAILAMLAAYMYRHKKHEARLLARLAEAERLRLKSPRQVAYEQAKEIAWEQLTYRFGHVATIDRYCKQYDHHRPKYLKSVFSPNNKEESPKAIQAILDNLAPDEQIVIAS